LEGSDAASDFSSGVYSALAQLEEKSRGGLAVEADAELWKAPGLATTAATNATTRGVRHKTFIDPPADSLRRDIGQLQTQRHHALDGARKSRNQTHSFGGIVSDEKAKRGLSYERGEPAK
jgi:hypothetical protein